MIIVKRRLLFWLFKAYLKKWGRLLIIGFLLGLIAFFLIMVGIKFLFPRILFSNHDVIGVVGSYTVDNLPENIIGDIAHGLTSVDINGQAKPDLARSWKIDNNQKTYTFYLQRDKFFSDGTTFTSHDIQIAFTDVKVKRPDNFTIVYELKDVYAPFLITVSRPIFKKGLTGIGTYAVKDIKVNSGFVQSISEYSVKNPTNTRIFRFYPTIDALKVAFALGEISQALNLNDIYFLNKSFSDFPNVRVNKSTDYTQLVTLFYNTQDSTLSDKRLRDALAYCLPNTFSEGDRAYSPFSPLSWAYQADSLHVQDFEHAKLLMQSAGLAAKNTIQQLTIMTLPQYKQTAQKIADLWQKIHIVTKIQVVESVPSSFQLYLGEYHIPKDPDQYTLWHSYQQNNITNYKSLRIDKLLEDGRKSLDQEARLKIYTDFQKYLIDDQPASFLYYPYSYQIFRK